MFGLRSCSPMLPATQMEESLNFYRALGFSAKMLDGTVAELFVGTISFYLKALPPSAGVTGPTMIATVPSLEEWWLKVKLLELGKHHRVSPPREPVLEPWGQRVGYIYDPCNATWQFSERAAANVAPGQRVRGDDPPSGGKGALILYGPPAARSQTRSWEARGDLALVNSSGRRP